MEHLLQCRIVTVVSWKVLISLHGESFWTDRATLG